MSTIVSWTALAPFQSARRTVRRPMQRERTLGYIGKIFFPDIPWPCRAFDRKCATAFRNQFFAVEGIIIAKNIFESIATRSQSGSAARAERKLRCEASMMKIYVTKCRKQVRARIFRLDVCRGCEVKCNCFHAELRAFMQQSYGNYLDCFVAWIKKKKKLLLKT